MSPVVRSRALVPEGAVPPDGRGGPVATPPATVTRAEGFTSVAGPRPDGGGGHDEQGPQPTHEFARQATAFVASLARWPTRTALVLGVTLIAWAATTETVLGGLATGEFVVSVVVGALLIWTESLMRAVELRVFRHAQENDATDAKSARELLLADTRLPQEGR